MTEPINHKECFNCKKQIETLKHRLHESTCSRNTFRCDKCQEIHPKCNQEQHEFEFHEVVRRDIFEFYVCLDIMRALQGL
jgi:hypothetical protein